MRILLVTGNLYPHGGGLSSHMELLRQGLEAGGHVVQIRSFGDFTPVQRIVTRGPSWVLNRIRRGWGALWTAVWRIRFLASVLRPLAHWAQVVHVQDPMAAAAARRLGLRYVYTAHGYPTDEHVAAGRIRPHTWAHRWLLNLEREGLRHALHVVAVDSRIAGHVERLAGHGRVTVIRNFVDIDWPQRCPPREEARRLLGIPGDAYVILCPRRLTAKNGVIYALEALALLASQTRPLPGVDAMTVEKREAWTGGPVAGTDRPGEEVPALVRSGPDGPSGAGPGAVRPLMLLVGAGEQEPEVRRFIRERRLEGICRLEGERPHGEMGLYLRAADVVVVPSVHTAGVEEATSISALEAMTFRVPLVGSAIGGLREIVRHGETGWLVPQRDPTALAHALAVLARDAGLAARLRENAHRYVVQHHSHLAVSRQFVRIYQRAYPIREDETAHRTPVTSRL